MKKPLKLDSSRVSHAPQVGLEPTTLRLTAECSAIELLRNMESGSDLLSRAVSSQVPSALKGLTSVFGMGTGVTPTGPCRPFPAIRLLNSRPFLPPFSSCPAWFPSIRLIGLFLPDPAQVSPCFLSDALRTLTTASDQEDSSDLLTNQSLSSAKIKPSTY